MGNTSKTTQLSEADAEPLSVPLETCGQTCVSDGESGAREESRRGAEGGACRETNSLLVKGGARTCCPAPASIRHVRRNALGAGGTTTGPHPPKCKQRAAARLNNAKLLPPFHALPSCCPPRLDVHLALRPCTVLRAVGEAGSEV